MSDKDFLALKLYDLFSSLNDEASEEEIEECVNYLLSWFLLGFIPSFFILGNKDYIVLYI